MLLHKHDEITPLLFRGGRVHGRSSSTTYKARDIELHPILQQTPCAEAFDLDDIYMHYNPVAGGSAHVAELPAIDELVTSPAISKITLDSFYHDQMIEQTTIKNERGVTVRDFLQAYCDFDPTPCLEICEEYALIDEITVRGIRGGYPVLKIDQAR